MACDKCKSDRILSIMGKCSDMFSADYKGVDYEGYVPTDLGIGGSDYIEMDICLECGKVQGIEHQSDPEFFTDHEDDGDEEEGW